MKQMQQTRMTWFICGVVGGLMISYFWPSEPALATDRDAGGAKFMIENVETGLGSSDAIFVLDFLTGRLYGASISQQAGKFNQFWYRNIMPDFKLSPDSKPSFVMTGGTLNVAVQGSNRQPAQGGLFIAELTSGRVHAYAFPYSISNRMNQPETLSIVDAFPFRQAVQ